MQKIIAREALKTLLKDGEDPTPEAYAKAYYSTAKKMGVVVELEFSIEKVLEMLTPEARENLPSKPFKNKNALLTALVKTINQLSFSKKNFSTSFEVLKLLLRLLSTYPQKEVSALAKGSLLEVDKLSSQLMQSWHRRWMEQVKSSTEFNFLDFLQALEILSNFKIPNFGIQKWQDDVRELLKQARPSKAAQIQLLKDLESQMLALSQQKHPSLNTQEAHIQSPKKSLEFQEVMALPIDATTTLMSKVGIQRVLDFAEQAFLDNGQNYSVIIFGIAKYEDIKSHFGLEAAKRILVTLGKLLKQYSNASDLISYLGDEEFLVCLLGKTKEESLAFIERIDGVVRKSQFMFQQTRIEISLVAQVSHRLEAEDLQSLLKRAFEDFRDLQGTKRSDV